MRPAPPRPAQPPASQPTSTPPPSPYPLAHALQTGLPMAGLAVAGAQFKLSAADRRLLWTVYAPWALRAGSRCEDLACLYYERHFEV
jgi:hypothetical protein